MSAHIGVGSAVIVTPQGFGENGLIALRDGAPVDRELIRPQCLKGKVFQIDPLTGLVASIADHLRRGVLAGQPAERLGIVVASRYGNQHILKTFGDRVRRQGQSPILFAASGYNVTAGVGAMAGNFNGPGLAIAGQGASLAAAVRRSLHVIARGDADVMLACIGDSTQDGSQAFAGALAIMKPKTAAMTFHRNLLNETPVPPGWLQDSLAFCPWFIDDAQRLLQLRALVDAPMQQERAACS